MAAEKTTLKSIKSSPKLAEQNFRPSDFLSQSEMDALHEANANRGRIRKPYDEVDAFESEILERYGWETYQAYQDGTITVEQLSKYLAASRAREAAFRYNLEMVIASANAGANNPNKNGRPPKTLKQCINIIKTEYKSAKGAQ